MNQFKVGEWRGQQVVAIALLVCQLMGPGCASTSKVDASLSFNGKDGPVIERGWPILPLDLIAKILAVPEQLLFWNFKLKNRNVSDETLEELRAFLIENGVTNVKVRVNQVALFDQYRRLFTNDEIFWLFRIFPGFMTTTISLILERFTAGDYYNPFTNTIHIFSDLPSVALHEGGHAKDFNHQNDGGFYAAVR